MDTLPIVSVLICSCSTISIVFVVPKINHYGTQFRNPQKWPVPEMCPTLARHAVTGIATGISADTRKSQSHNYLSWLAVRYHTNIWPTRDL